MSKANIRRYIEWKRKRFRDRVLLLLGIALFVGCMQWCYVNWLNPKFAFYGFDYYPPKSTYLMLAWTLSLLPALWMPLQFRRPSQLIYWMLYLTVFIPSMFVPLFVELDQASDVARLSLTLFAGFAICGASYLRPLRRFSTIPVTRTTFWRLFWILAIGCTLIVVIAYHRTMKLVSFSEIYQLRDESMDHGAIVNYAMMWLYGAIYPFVLGWGLYYKRRGLIAAGTIGQLLIYSAFGTKASVLSVVFTLGFYGLFRFGRGPFGLKLTWGIALVFLLVAVSVAAFGTANPLHFVFVSLVSMRTFGLPGLLTAQYYYFFHHNPFTYYGHIKLIGFFIKDPYNMPLGTIVGYYYYYPLIDATAHLWAADGLAAMGLTGILLISVFCGFVFWVLDSATSRHSPRLVALVITYAAINICSIGIFTTLLSGGLGLLIVLLHFIPASTAPEAQEARSLIATAPAT
jgi:hypothetical protein